MEGGSGKLLSMTGRTGSRRLTTSPPPAASKRVPAGRPPIMSELEFQRQVIAEAETFGWRIYHIRNSQKVVQGHTGVGFPDVVAAHPSGLLVIAELKTVRGRPSTDQMVWLDLFSNVFGNNHPTAVVVLWTPAHLPLIRRVFQRQDWPIRAEDGLWGAALRGEQS